MEHTTVENAWAQISISASLPSKINTAWVDTLTAVGKAINVSTGEIIIEVANKEIDLGFIIISGSYSIFKEGAPSMIKQGPEMVGEMSRFNPLRSRTAEVRAESDVTAISFDWNEVFTGLAERLSDEEVKQLNSALEHYAWDHFTDV